MLVGQCIDIYLRVIWACRIVSLSGYISIVVSVIVVIVVISPKRMSNLLFLKLEKNLTKSLKFSDWHHHENSNKTHKHFPPEKIPPSVYRPLSPIDPPNYILIHQFQEVKSSRRQFVPSATTNYPWLFLVVVYWQQIQNNRKIDDCPE